MARNRPHADQPFFLAADSSMSITVETILVRTQSAAMPCARSPSPSLSSASALAGSNEVGHQLRRPPREGLRVWGHVGANTVELC